MREAEGQRRLATRTGYDVVRIALGLLLLTAAALKGHQLATEPIVETSLLTSRWVLIGVVEFELFFGLWLLAGLYPRWTWRAALLCFGGFACISLHKAVSGEASCGCFGRASVSPWYALILDLAAVGAMFSWRPPEPRWKARAYSRFAAVRVGGVAAMFLVTGIPVGLAMGAARPFGTSTERDIVFEGGFVVLRPKSWLGKPFPLLRHIDAGDEIGQGEWIVVLHRDDCPACADAVPEFVRLADRLAMSPGAPRTAIVGLPPYGESEDAFSLRCASCRTARVDDAYEWFVQTPVTLLLSNGVVRAIGDSVGDLQGAM